METSNNRRHWSDNGDITAKTQRMVPADGCDITDYTPTLHRILHWFVTDFQKYSHEKQQNTKRTSLYKVDFIQY